MGNYCVLEIINVNADPESSCEHHSMLVSLCVELDFFCMLCHYVLFWDKHGNMEIMFKEHFIHSSLRWGKTELIITHFSAFPPFPDYQIIQEQGALLNIQIMLTMLLELTQPSLWNSKTSSNLKEKPWYYHHGIFIMYIKTEDSSQSLGFSQSKATISNR